MAVTAYTRYVEYEGGGGIAQIALTLSEAGGLPLKIWTIREAIAENNRRAESLYERATGILTQSDLQVQRLVNVGDRETHRIFKKVR